MAKRNKNKRSSNPPFSAAKRSASPTLINIRVTFYRDTSENKTEFESVEAETKIKFPCTLAEFAWQLANCSFTLAEDLAEKSGWKFLAEKEIEI